MQVGTLFARIIPQARNRGFMLIAGFEADVNQRTMVRYVTLASVTQKALDAAYAEVQAMLGAKHVEDVTKPDVHKKFTRILEQQEANSRGYAMRLYR